MGKKSFISPFSLWKNLAKKPTTIRYPYEDLDVFDEPGISPVYRGLHTNDMDTCIGCGTCEDICPTAAITMVKGKNTGDGKLGQRPDIDYGRCCFCGFCVDICPSSSLAMSRDYIYKLDTPVDVLGDEETELVKDHFMIVPGEEHKENRGWVTADEDSWLDLERYPMGHLAPKERHDSFIEIVKGFSKEEALAEASRCLECGVCTETCPANMKIPEYIKAIWSDDVDESVRQIYIDNPFPNVCGRVCTHKCETVCALQHRGEAIAIRWLKRYAVDTLSNDAIINQVKEGLNEKKSGKKIAIIGSGPAGLAAAYYLVLLGHDVTVFEKEKLAGGVMRYGIPRYRLPHEAVDEDIEVIKKLGVTIKTNTAIGKKITIDALKKEFNAVLISTGFNLSRSTKIKCINHKHVYQALDLLAKIAIGKDIHVGKKIVVIGGGNVAFDIGRSLARLQRQKKMTVDVTIMSLEGECEMPADVEEIDEGQDEGVTLKPERSPREVILNDDGSIKEISTVHCVCVFDKSGKFNPQCDISDVQNFKADMIVEAIGQAPDYSYLDKFGEKLTYERGKVKTDKMGRTDLPWLFAAGDIVRGPDVIHAIADGHNAAKAIDGFLSKKKKR
jgi:glutamate synthase (NADPH/NADH) small chain